MDKKTAAEVERFKKGFPWLEIVAPATLERGIKTIDFEKAAQYEPLFPVRGKCKFVPASGAASRMFKDIFTGLETLRSGTDIPADAPLSRLAANIKEFAFWSEALFGKDVEDSAGFRLAVAEKVLESDGLGYGTKPKGVIRFHRYADGECRTAFEEHMVEGQVYMLSEDGTVRMTVTISPEHKALFEEVLADAKVKYEAKYGVKYDVRFTYQDPDTDTTAVDMDNAPFLKEDGSVLKRPAGHGALIRNLDDVKEELVSIKNIDNVSCERHLPVTSLCKKALEGKCLELRDRIFMYIQELEMASHPIAGLSDVYPFLPGYNAPVEDPCATPECQELCREIEDFFAKELCIEMPLAKDCKSRVEALFDKLNRPIRVCGMVRNTGEPGGGPFIIKEKDGSTSLQILESVQIDKNNPQAVEALNSATHFNPVDIVCCTYDYEGKKFNLEEFVDEDTGFISKKSYQGRELKALELPGLWNGSMSGWNTMFVEVPAETFSPVKTVLDLLKDAHRA